MAAVLKVYMGDEQSEIQVDRGSTYSVGKAIDNNIVLHQKGLPRNCFSVHVGSDEWVVQNISRQFKNGTVKSGKSALLGEILVFDVQRKLAATVFNRPSEYEKNVNISQKSRVVIGRSSTCDIVIDSQLVSGKHVELLRQGNVWLFRDLSSSNGTYLNGYYTENGVLKEGESLSIGLSQITLSHDELFVQADTKTVVNIDSVPTQQMVRCVDGPDATYPFTFEQSPRLRSDVPRETIEIDPPPSIAGSPSISWLNVLLMPVLSVAVMFLVCYFLVGTMHMLYFSVPMTLVGAIMAIVRYSGEKKKHRAREQLRADKYNDYIASQAKRINGLAEEQRRILTEENPPLSQCCWAVENTDRALWDRRFGDSDFMSLRVGLGEIPCNVTVRVPREAFRLEEDILVTQLSDIAKRHEKVKGCPILVELGKHLTCGIIGRREKVVELSRSLIVQAAFHHSYEDLRIVIFCSADEREEWSPARWLPHVFNDNRSIRYISDTPKQHSVLQEQLNGLFLGTGENESPPQHFMFICASSDPQVNRSVTRYLATAGSGAQASAIFLASGLSGLPQECHYIIDLTAEAVIYEKERASQRTHFEPDGLPRKAFEKFSRNLAPLRIDSKQGSQSIPTMVSFLEGNGAKTPKDLDLENKWATPLPERGMSVPIGLKENGKPFCFDIHEKQSGPHGLVAGMTGSGKSEMVQSWILSMAVKFPPSAVSFVLIDFKGTGLLLPFKRLPHLAGMISDLDTSIGRNLIALENELQRRKALLDQYQVGNISSYLKLLHSGRATEPLPFLFIVIDEFAEFKAKFPDFMQVVDRVFAIGRTLGIHMILLTQKPANVVDDKMNANTRFRWCLKVASSADSRDMLRHPDAAKIMNPGRAFVQVGEDEVYEEIQSFWSGAPYNPNKDLCRKNAAKVSIVDLYGQRTTYEPERTTGYRAEKSEIDAVVEYIDLYAQKNNIPRAKAIWISSLPETVHLRDILQLAFDGERWNQSSDTLQVALGLVDDPRSQVQYPFFLSLADTGSVAVYGAPGAGKTSLLHTTIMSLAMSYPPDFVHMYLMDFGGGSLTLFKDIPHVGEAVVGGRDDEAIHKLAEMLLDELNRRKSAISQLGLMNIGAYREVTQEPMPYVVILVDNFAPVLQLYPELDSFFQTISRDGLSCGIFLMVTANAQNSIGYRINQNINYVIALRMQDRGDYASLVGRTEGLVPENFPGRGLMKGNPPLEFQAALPADGANEAERVRSIREVAQMMRSAWRGETAPGVPVVPEVVRASDHAGHGILLGITCKDATPCTFDPAQQHSLIISSAEQSRVPYRAIYQQLRQYMPTATVLAYGEGADDGVQRINGTEFDRAIADLMPVLQERKRAKMAQPLPFSEYPGILILIDDLKSCFDQIDNDTVPRLTNIVNLGRGLNVYLIVNGISDSIDKLYYGGETFTVSLVKQAAALLIGASARHHKAFQTNLPFSEASEPLAGAEGYYLQAGQAKKIKVVQE